MQQLLVHRARGDGGFAPGEIGSLLVGAFNECLARFRFGQQTLHGARPFCGSKRVEQPAALADNLWQAGSR